MRKIIWMISIFYIVLFTITAQSVPHVSIRMATASAIQGQSVVAEVIVDSDIEMIGADVEITIDDACLEIKGDIMQGEYFPAGDGVSVVLFQEKTESTVRFATNMLDFNRNPKSGGIYFTVPLTVTCNSGTASLSVTKAHLVQRGIVEYKLVDDQVTTQDVILTLGSEAVEMSIDETPVVDNNGDLKLLEAPELESSEMLSLIPIALIFIVIAIVGISFLFILYRRSRQ